MKSVYIAFAADNITINHVELLKKAVDLGEITIGVLTNEAISRYKRDAISSYEDRVTLAKSLCPSANIYQQNDVNLRKALLDLKPDFLVHADDWQFNNLHFVREAAIETLNEYGGRLVEIEYKKSRLSSNTNKNKVLSVTPGFRLSRIKSLLEENELIELLEVHSALSGLIVENSSQTDDFGKRHQFDGMWSSSLTDSTLKGMPDIEVVDITSRMQTVDQILRVSSKPIIFDADTGGKIEHIPYTVNLLEKSGVSAIVIEDKVGLKKNSLFGNDVEQSQDDIVSFQQKINAIKQNQGSSDFMAIARIESLILDKGMDDALLRCGEYIDAGADAIMIHSRHESPDEIFEFCKKYHKRNHMKPLMVVPTSFNNVTRSEWIDTGVSIVCHANHMLRASYPAMQKIANSILRHGRSYEAERDNLCMPIKEILDLIPRYKMNFKEQYDENGYYVYKDLITLDHINNIKASLSRIFPNDDFQAQFVKSNVRTNIYKLLQNLSSIRDAASYAVKNISHIHFEENEPISISSAIIIQIPSEQFNNPLHQDVYNYFSGNFCKMWIPLTMVDMTCGSMKIYESSHKSGVIEPEHDESRYPKISENAIQDKKGRVFDLKPDGVGVCFNPLILHESVPNITKKMRITLGVDVQSLKHEHMSNKNVKLANEISQKRAINRLKIDNLNG